MRIEGIKDSNVYLVDLSYILYRSYHAMKSLGITNQYGVFRPTGHIHGVLGAIMGIADYDNDGIILITLDGYPKERAELCESVGIEYKDGRSKPEYNIKGDISTICDLLCHIPNTYIVESDFAESDDIMFALSRHLHESNTCYIYTRDNDLLQAIDDRTFVIRDFNNGTPTIINEDIYMTSEEFTKKFYSVPPKKLPYFRALTGDSSDNIKGVYRIPKVLASAIAINTHDIGQYENATYHYCEYATKTQQKYLKSIEDDFHRISVNYKIMMLSDNIEYDVVNELHPIKDIATNLKLKQYLDWLSNRGINVI